MLNDKKLERVGKLSYENALRLHRDAISLYKLKSFPSAFYLSVLSQEEIGKMHMSIRFLTLDWDSDVERREFFLKLDETLLYGLYKHSLKHSAFLRNSPLEKFSMHGWKMMEKISNGSLETKKQNSVYVGLNKTRGKINLTGAIRNPFSVTKGQASLQITKINDYLLVVGIGIRFENLAVENEYVEQRMKNRGMLRSLNKKWKRMGRKAAKLIRLYQQYFNEEVLAL